MTVISCYGCKHRDPSHLVGSKSEHLYYSVGTMYSENKLFFCTENCYKDSVFVSAVVAEGARTLGTSPDLRLTITELGRHKTLGELAESMYANYDDIVEPSLNHYSLEKFKERVKGLVKTK